VSGDGGVYLKFTEPMYDESLGFNISDVNLINLNVEILSAETGLPINFTWQPDYF